MKPLDAWIAIQENKALYNGSFWKVQVLLPTGSQKKNQAFKFLIALSSLQKNLYLVCIKILGKSRKTGKKDSIFFAHFGRLT